MHVRGAAAIVNIVYSRRYAYARIFRQFRVNARSAKEEEYKVGRRVEVTRVETRDVHLMVGKIEKFGRREKLRNLYLRLLNAHKIPIILDTTNLTHKVKRLQVLWFSGWLIIPPSRWSRYYRNPEIALLCLRLKNVTFYRGELRNLIFAADKLQKT